MVAGIDHGDTFRRDMGYSEAEFFRVLPRAISGYAYTVTGNRVTISSIDEARRLTLELRRLPDRRIGMISVPRLEVSFSFENFSDAERREFMRGFDQSYQRGGG